MLKNLVKNKNQILNIAKVEVALIKTDPKTAKSIINKCERDQKVALTEKTATVFLKSMEHSLKVASELLLKLAL